MPNKKTVLNSIIKANGIVSGYSFRGKIIGSPNGNLRVVQLKDMENEYTSIGNYCTLIDADEVNEKYYLKKGDILFISKGANNFATVFELDDILPTVASSVFYVIKVNTLKAEPQYVAWYINKSIVQQYFQAHSAGTYSLSLNKEVIEGIPLQLPSLEMQKTVAKVAKLAQKEQYIYKSLKEKRDQLIEAQLLKSID
ncbi:MAG: restriction endonuclease subunit S [Flavobacteriales bacterium]|nr:restriction endonuclease subunit S [Flavobacteriales bacterium]